MLCLSSLIVIAGKPTRLITALSSIMFFDMRHRRVYAPPHDDDEASLTLLNEVKYKKTARLVSSSPNRA